MNESFVSLEAVGRAWLQGKVNTPVLASITGSVVPGDRIAVMGPSGSGKSTLLHIMGGLDAPTSGNISWPALGSRKHLRPRQIGMVFQMQTLLAPLTAVENVELPLLIGNMNLLEARAAALKALDDIGLESIADKLPEELSGGQAQRVGVARALASRPRLILADEPTGQLDHPTAQHLLDVLLAAIAHSDTALVVATHDPAIAERMRTLWHIRRGELEID